MSSFNCLFNLERPENLPFEIVERKGIGHPDTLADMAAEAVSVAFSRYCLEKFGVILNHNIDKLLLGGGLSQVELGNGRLVKPIHIFLNGRMTKSFGGIPLPFQEIQDAAVKHVLKQGVPLLDLSQDIVFDYFTTDHSATPTWFNPRDKTDITAATKPFASDTALVVGWWPLSPTEQLVIGLEASLYNQDWQPLFKDIGQDVKVMALRKGRHIEVTVCVPFLAQHTPSLEIYHDRRREIANHFLACGRKILTDDYELTVAVNTQTDHGARRPYVVAKGTCLEFGEEGVVGRGNSVYGCISAFRPHTAEAPFGKNPLYHSGKVYAYMVRQIATAIAKEFECSCVVLALLRNGDPLFDFRNVTVQLSRECDPALVRQTVERIFAEEDHLKGLLLNAPLIPKQFLLKDIKF
jgi:S-adenosylmethionine synthetase